MAPKFTFSILCLLLTISLAGCATKTQANPTSDQKAIASAVAATLEAGGTATHSALPTLLPSKTSTPSPSPTPEPTLPLATPTLAPSPSTTLPPAPQLLVAYTKNSDVNIWSASTGSTRLTDMHDVNSVRLSDDGTLVAFKLQDPNDVTQQELWVVNTRGVPNPRLLVSADQLDALVPPDQSANILGYGVLDFSWRPGTHELAFSTLALHEGPGFDPNHDVRLVNTDTLVKTTLFDTGQGGIFYYSPDGNQIALSNPESISLVNADGSNLRRNVLTYLNVITYSEYEYHPHPKWAADSGSLRVAIPPHDPLGTPRPETALWSIPVDGSPSVLLGSIPAIAFAWPDTAFSPSLEVVGYSANAASADPNQRDLHISRPDGSEDRLADSGDSLEFISWAPDSQHFIYRVQGGPNEGLYSGGLTGTPVKLVADPHTVRDIQWVDGTRFVYLINNNGSWELHLANVAAQDLALIDTIPDASPDFDLVP